MLNLSLSPSQGFTLQSPKLPPHHRSLSSKVSLTTAPATHFDPASHPIFKTPPAKPSVKSRQSSEYFAPQQQQRFAANSDPPSPPRVFVGHSIYKGKAALTVEPRPPEFSPLDSGAFKLAKEGFVLLQFAPAAAARQYDWSRKQVFSLSVTEMGTIMSLGAKDSCEFFHDPFKGKSEEGRVRKVLKVEPLPDGSGHFFNLSVQNKLINVDENIYIPITKAEYTVLVSAFNFIIPYLLGWHTFANSIKPDDTSRGNNANSRAGADYEWSR
ncbi:hypothetical protein RJ639_040654 [Escallonia herrerae]|uniref:Single-stranded DNA-binding protein WHY1, chloroplastic n=1 Tax=Escallonia herrerae TaxID=1293975 RepID=A0AA89B6R8_9ASTE|nr:hypothetical protein RJ639_040654 [Escallonia herrerae]